METTTSKLIGDPQFNLKNRFSKILIGFFILVFSLIAFVIAYNLSKWSDLSPKESSADTIIKLKKCKYDVECKSDEKCLENICSKIEENSEIY